MIAKKDDQPTLSIEKRETHVTIQFFKDFCIFIELKTAQMAFLQFETNTIVCFEIQVIWIRDYLETP